MHPDKPSPTHPGDVAVEVGSPEWMALLPRRRRWPWRSLGYVLLLALFAVNYVFAEQRATRQRAVLMLKINELLAVGSACSRTG